MLLSLFVRSARATLRLPGRGLLGLGELVGAGRSLFNTVARAGELGRRGMRPLAGILFGVSRIGGGDEKGGRSSQSSERSSSHGCDDMAVVIARKLRYWRSYVVDGGIGWPLLGWDC